MPLSCDFFSFFFFLSTTEKEQKTFCLIFNFMGIFEISENVWGLNANEVKKKKKFEYFVS